MPKLSGGGARGHLHVHCRVETPRDLDEQQAELLRDFAAARGEDLAAASQDGRGLLGRLREAFGA
jgi:molecular chaperone DnaJ